MEERRVSILNDRRETIMPDRRCTAIPPSHDKMHITMWVAAVFCSVYVGILFFYFLMPISFWVEWYDVYPLVNEYEVGEDIILVSHIYEKRVSDHKFIDTMFCKKDGSDVYLRHDQQSQSNYAEGPQPELRYQFPFNKPVMNPGWCYVNSSLILFSPLGHTKSKKLFGNKGEHEHYIRVGANPYNYVP